MTAGFPSDSADDAVQANIAVIAPITSGSAQQDKGDSTWIVRRGLADSSCVSFESRGNPGYFLRQRPGNDRKGNSFYSANDSTKYIRHYYGKVYIAGDGGPKSWDATALWSNDTSFVVGPPWWP